jgi:hypothetical protein
MNPSPCTAVLTIYSITDKFCVQYYGTIFLRSSLSSYSLALHLGIVLQYRYDVQHPLAFGRSIISPLNSPLERNSILIRIFLGCVVLDPWSDNVLYPGSEHCRDC